jgi:hypothetical protein
LAILVVMVGVLLYVVIRGLVKSLEPVLFHNSADVSWRFNVLPVI